MMPTITIINNEDAVVLYKTAEVLRRDFDQLCKRLDIQWDQLLADHAEASAAITRSVPLAKADRRTEQNLLLKEYLARLEIQNATLEKIRDWLNARNCAIAEHTDVAARSERFAKRHARFCNNG